MSQSESMKNIETKLSDINGTMIGMKEEIQSLRLQIVKQNGRVTKLEDKAEEGVRKDAEIETRLKAHMDQSDKLVEQFKEGERSITKKIDGLSKNQWIGYGVLSAVLVLGPFLLEKIFQ